MAVSLIFVVNFFVSLVSGVPAPAPAANALPADATKYLFAFGDSYTENGFTYNGAFPTADNIIGNPAFPGVTTSGDLNWVEYLATEYNQTTNFVYDIARGGAVVNKSLINYGNADFITQVKAFYTSVVKTKAVPFTASNSVFLIWFGQNDVYRGYQVADTQTLYTNVASSYINMCESLYKDGARNFVFLSLGAISSSYLVQSLPKTDQTLIANASTLFNAKLQAGVKTFVTKHTDVVYRYINPATSFTNVLNKYKSYGAPNSTCYIAQNASCLWYNHFHPGYQIHQAVAKQIASYATFKDFFSV